MMYFKTLIAFAVIVASVKGQDFGEFGSDFDFGTFFFPSNGSDCGPWFDCPPNDILFMPPPPLPPSLRHLILENQSLADQEEGECNFCHLFRDQSQDSEFVSPKNPDKMTDSMISVLVASGLGLIFGFLLLGLIWCKKWRIFPAKDSCPMFPENFLGGHKSAPSPPNPIDSCISPVVNEKSPQSIITDDPHHKTSIPSKYWRRGGEYMGNPNSVSRNLDGPPHLDDHYTDGSCTSSPVYAELDGQPPPGTRLSLDPNTMQPILIAGPSQNISPYTVGLNSYAEVPDTMRMSSLSSSSALIPDTSYDNAAYLPSSLAGHYTRSLRRGQGITLAHLGSAAPLLTAQQHAYHVGPPAVSYLTGGRVSKKPRPPYAQNLARNAIQRMHQDLVNDSIERGLQPRYTTRRLEAMLSDAALNSPNMSTFKSSSPIGYSRDNPKRPLPPVPGVRL